MTREQIAELRFNAGALVKLPLLERLIDEREALLEALKELSLRIHDPDVHISGDGASHLMLAYAIQEADAAIAKAEAE